MGRQPPCTCLTFSTHVQGGGEGVVVSHSEVIFVEKGTQSGPKNCWISSALPKNRENIVLKLDILKFRFLDDFRLGIQKFFGEQKSSSHLTFHTQFGSSFTEVLFNVTYGAKHGLRI